MQFLRDVLLVGRAKIFSVAAFHNQVTNGRSSELRSALFLSFSYIYRNITEQNLEERPLVTCLLNAATVICELSRDSPRTRCFLYILNRNKLCFGADILTMSTSGRWFSRAKRIAFLHDCMNDNWRRIYPKYKPNIFWRDSSKAQYRKYIQILNKLYISATHQNHITDYIFQIQHTGSGAGNARERATPDRLNPRIAFFRESHTGPLGTVWRRTTR